VTRSRWTRRATLAAASGFTAATLADSSLAHSHHSATRLAAARGKLEQSSGSIAFSVLMIGKLRGDLAGRPVYLYNPGSVFGVVPGQGRSPAEFAQRLYRVEGVTKRISRLRDDGTVEEKSASWMFYCDWDTGAYLTEFRNPYTSELLRVPPLRGGPSHTLLTARGIVAESLAGLESTALDRPPQLDWRLLGDTAWISRHAASRIRPAQGGVRNEFSIDAWVAKIVDVADERATHISAIYSWTSHAEWQSWLNMPRHPGHLLWRIESTLLRDVNDLPTAFVAQLERAAPGKLAEPLHW
jgi:hypothetical protein